MAKKPTKSKDVMTFHLFAVNLLEKLIGAIRKLMTANLLEFCSTWLGRLGHIGIIVAAGLGFLFSFIFAMRSNNFQAFLYGLAWVLLIFVIQLTAHKFSTAAEKQIQDNPSTVSSRAFLDCFAFLVLIGGILALIMSIVRAVRLKSFEEFLMGLGMFVFLEFVALVAFNPKEVTVEVVEGNSAGQEAIGIMAFIIKTFTKLIPILFGAGVILFTVMMFVDFFSLFGDNYGFAMSSATQNAMYIAGSALLPFLGYLFFVLAYLLLDIIRAILSIPNSMGK